MSASTRPCQSLHDETKTTNCAKKPMNFYKPIEKIISTDMGYRHLFAFFNLDVVFNFPVLKLKVPRCIFVGKHYIFANINRK